MYPQNICQYSELTVTSTKKPDTGCILEVESIDLALVAASAGFTKLTASPKLEASMSDGRLIIDLKEVRIHSAS